MVSFKKAAQKILNKSEEPLSVKEITDIALQEGLIDTGGETPEATMGAQLYVDIQKDKDSPFIKVGKGIFTLRSKKKSGDPNILIESNNEKVKIALLKKLLEMDPYQFEFFIADLLQKVGYEDIEVTKRSNDGGIDITANLTVRGITNVKTAIQVKRFKSNIPGKIVTQLRGSAEVGQRGLIITTSDFTKEAIKESKAQNKTPISLVNGKKLLSLLFEYEVAVKKEEKIVYSIDTDYFQTETEVLKKHARTEKNRSIWPLPGGTQNYIATLNKFLEVVKNGTNTKQGLIEWFIDNFENVQSEKTANGYIFVPKSMGLIDVVNGTYSVSDEGKSYLEDKSFSKLYEIISKNVFAFDEIVEFLKTSNEPKNENEILNYLKENLGVEWTTFAQLNFRLMWLRNLNKINKIQGGYTIK